MRVGLSDRFQEQASFFDITKGGGKTGRKVFSTLGNNSPEPGCAQMHSSCDLNFFHTGDTNYILLKQAYKYTPTQQDHSENQLSI